MKKFLTFLIICLSIFFLCACNSTNENKYDEFIKTSISEIKSFWENKYNETDSTNRKNDVFIVNTRLFTIDETTDREEYKGVKYIIEFVIYSDYYGTNGKYYSNIGLYDSIAVYNDNTFFVYEQSPFKRDIMLFELSFSMIKDTVDLGAQYNQRIILDINN